MFKCILLLNAIAVLMFTSCGSESKSSGVVISADREFVDLGLASGTLWATCNVGATKPEEYGDYFAWGETEAKVRNSSSNSKWYNVEYSDLKAQGVIDANGNLTAQYDVATTNWSKNWRMPTHDEIKELISLENVEADVNGIKGRKFIGKNGNTLFLPFAGDRGKGELRNVGEYGNYWSATAYGDDWRAYYLNVYSDAAYLGYYGNRNYGQVVRLVLKNK